MKHAIFAVVIVELNSDVIRYVIVNSSDYLDLQNDWNLFPLDYQYNSASGFSEYEYI
jgi:hypothetical protein